MLVGYEQIGNIAYPTTAWYTEDTNTLNGIQKHGQQAWSTVLANDAYLRFFVN
jgi:hypothetical protein